MKKFLIWYIFSYVLVTFLYWLTRAIYEHFVLMPSITDQSGSYNEMELLAFMARTIPPYFVIKSIIFAIVPLFFKVVRSDWRHLLVVYLIFALLSIFGDFVFGVVGVSLLNYVLGLIIGFAG